MGRLDTDARREQLLDLGLTLFGSRSYEDVAIADIATEAGISRGLLYHYFGGKRDFYVAVVERAAQRLLQALEEPMSRPQAERGRAGIEAYLAYVEAHDNAFVALVRGGLGADARVHEILENTRDAIASRMLESLGLDEPRPAFRLAARTAIGAVETASLEWLSQREQGVAVPREHLITVCFASVAVHIGMAIRLDPDAGLQPDPAVQAEVMRLLLQGS